MDAGSGHVESSRGDKLVNILFHIVVVYCARGAFASFEVALAVFLDGSQPLVGRRGRKSLNGF